MSHDLDLDPRRINGLWLRAPRGRIELEFEQESPAPGARKPVLFAHSQVSRSCRAAPASPDPAPKKLELEDTNPGFVQKNGTLIEDAVLSKLVFDFLKAKFPALLTAQSKASGRASPGDQVRIGLADLKGIDKLCAPKIAGFGLTNQMIGGSTSKILIYYAAHQLLFDLKELVRVHRIPTLPELRQRLKTVWKGMKCEPDLSWLFTFRNSPPGGLLGIEMNRFVDIDARACARAPAPPRPSERPAHLVGYLNDIVKQCDSTRKASELIMRIGFEYIASLAAQSGLWHPQRSGLWFGSTYCSDILSAPVDRNCHSKTNSFCGAESRVLWKDDASGTGAILATALSVTTYYTLLAQRRLVSPAHSSNIEGYLKHACNYLKSGALLPTRARKCADVGTLMHDGGLVDEGPGKARYAIAILTDGKPTQLPMATFKAIARVMDSIVKNRVLPP
jgi:hypothetical protein